MTLLKCENVNARPSGPVALFTFKSLNSRNTHRSRTRHHRCAKRGAGRNECSLTTGNGKTHLPANVVSNKFAFPKVSRTQLPSASFIAGTPAGPEIFSIIDADNRHHRLEPRGNRASRFLQRRMYARYSSQMMSLHLSTYSLYWAVPSCACLSLIAHKHRSFNHGCAEASSRTCFSATCSRTTSKTHSVK